MLYIICRFCHINDKKDTVLVEVPDFKIFTEGYGMLNAIEMARDAIELAGITIEDMGREIPLPINMQDIDTKHTEFKTSGQSIIYNFLLRKSH